MHYHKVLCKQIYCTIWHILNEVDVFEYVVYPKEHPTVQGTISFRWRLRNYM